MLNTEEMKKKTGRDAARLVEAGTTIGIGTGSTVYYFIEALSEMVKNGFQVSGIATSRETQTLAESRGIRMLDLGEADCDLTIDGADEIDENLQLIKGGGGALLQEKMVAAASRKLVIIADHGKLVRQLGVHPLPVEVIPYGWKQTQKHIAALGCPKVVLRIKDGQTFVSDHGHYILDCTFMGIADAPLLNQQLNDIPGVVENGLFIHRAAEARICYPDGSIKVIQK